MLYTDITFITDAQLSSSQQKIMLYYQKHVQSQKLLKYKPYESNFKHSSKRIFTKNLGNFFFFFFGGGGGRRAANESEEWGQVVGERGEATM